MKLNKRVKHPIQKRLMKPLLTRMEGWERGVINAYLSPLPYRPPNLPCASSSSAT